MIDLNTAEPQTPHSPVYSWPKSISMTPDLELFREAMRNVIGAAPDSGKICPGKIIRFSTGDDRRNTNGWCKLFDDGEGGVFGDWATGLKGEWQARQPRSESEREAWRLRIEQERKKADQERRERQAAAATKAAQIWAEATPAEDHPYLTRKGILPHGARRLGEDLLVYVNNGTGITSLQQIRPDGVKRFMPDGAIQGGAYVIGEVTDAIVICEGFATGASIHEATGFFVLVAFDAGNLVHVARRAREVFPDNLLIIAADDDAFNKDGSPRAPEKNTGIVKARAAAEELGVQVAAPPFPSPRTKDQGSDFNDLAVLYGADTVRAAFIVATASPTLETKTQVEPMDEPFSMADLIQKKFKPIQWAVPGLLPEGLAILSGPPKIGKSWLVMDLCLAVTSGGYSLGHFKVDQGEALLLSLEDNDRRLKERLEIRTSTDPNANLRGFHAQTTWPRLDSGGLARLEAWLKKHPACKIVVIDTIQKIKAKPANKNGNAYENDYESYGALQRLALERQCCILVIHHNRKSDSKNEADPLEAISGSIGITGTMDTIMMLKRPRGGTGAVLTVTGRDIADAQYGLTFDKVLRGWTVSGPGAELGLHEGSNATRVIDVMKERPGEGMSVQDVFEALCEEIKWDTVKRELYRLAKKGLVHNIKGQFVLKCPVSPVSLVTPSQGHSDTSDTRECIEACTDSGFSDTSDTSDTSDLKQALPDWGRRCQKEN